MKIIFLCGSLEVGRDGVGDYTRRFAGELISTGCTATLVALRDTGIDEFLSDTQVSDDDITVPVLRFPDKMPARLRMAKLKKYIASCNPDWISLQYVPFSFNNKGIHFGLAQELAYLGKGCKWHIMFHELWVGRNQSSSLKQWLWSSTQQWQIKKLVSVLKPEIVHTHLPLYQSKLSSIGIKASPLPLFSNIRKYKHILAEQPRGNFKFAFFSQVDSSQPILDFINTLSNFAVRKGLTPELVIIGGEKNKMMKLTEVFQHYCPELIHVSATGFLDAIAVSRILSECDLGLTPVPTHALGKSGSVAAFLAHGVPVAAPLVHQGFSQTQRGFFNEEMDAMILVKPFWEDFERVKKKALIIQKEIHITNISKLFISDLLEKVTKV